MLLAAPTAIAGVVVLSGIEVFTALAPNRFGSPSFAPWEGNVIAGLYAGQTSYGTVGPTQFNAETNPIDVAQAMVSGFPSWRGQINPAAAFGSAYANELGNRMTFALRINIGQQFAINQLGFDATSTDPFNGLDFSFTPGSYNYGSGYVGVLFGTDGAWDGGDDTFITTGPSSQLVDGLIGRGSGNSFAAYCTVCDAADQLQALADTAAYPGSPFTFTGGYYLVNPNGGIPIAEGAGTFEIGEVPEPGSFALLTMALLVFTRRRIEKK